MPGNGWWLFGVVGYFPVNLPIVLQGLEKTGDRRKDPDTFGQNWEILPVPFMEC